jgi:hypothetical protein
MLRKAGLSVDWMTVYVGWRGLSGPYGTYDLLSHEVIEFAYDCLGTSPPKQADAVFHVADAEPTNAGLHRERCFLEELARQSGVNEQTALRKWRLADAVGVQESAAFWLRGKGAVDSDHDVYAAEILWEFETFWQKFSECGILPILDLSRVWQNVKEVSELLDEWIVRERAALLPSSIKRPSFN